MGQGVPGAAEKIYDAEKSRKPISKIEGITLENAHHIQFTNIDRAVSEGARISGYKIGLTSRHAQAQFGVFEPDFGTLLNTMEVPVDGVIDPSTLIQARIESEIAFVLGRDLKGPGVTFGEVLSAVDCALAALEIVDCRFEGWKIGAPELVADNGASARYVLGTVQRKVSELDLPFLGMTLSRGGEILHTGAGAAVMGHPLNAIVSLANKLGAKGKSLRAGDVVLSGALSAMLPLNPHSFYSCEIASLGRASVRTTGAKHEAQ